MLDPGGSGYVEHTTLDWTLGSLLHELYLAPSKDGKGVPRAVEREGAPRAVEREAPVPHRDTAPHTAPLSVPHTVRRSDSGAVAISSVETSMIAVAISSSRRETTDIPR